MSPSGSMKPPPPEEKLLSIIRKAPKSGPQPETAQSTIGGAAKAASIPKRHSTKSPAWTRIAMISLGVVLVLEVVLLIVQAAAPTPTITIPPPIKTASVETEVSKPDVPSLADAASPQLFSAVAETATTSSGRNQPSSTANQLASRLTLLGIISGEPPQAIIEDTKTKKSYFVTTGQIVVEGAVLEKVLETYVILDLYGEKIELTL